MRPAWITGRKVPPRPLVGVVLFSFEDVHVVTQEDERVRAGTRAEDVAVVVDVAGWGQVASGRWNSTRRDLVRA